MSMSTYVVGVKPPDATWIAMKNVWDACEAAGIEKPDAVLEFFDGKYGSSPDPRGVIVELPDGAVRRCGRYDTDGFEVDVRQLPPDVAVVRFVNSW